MRADLLDVVVPMTNPLRWKVREAQFTRFIDQMVAAGVRLTVVECALGERPFMFADDPRLKAAGARHVGVRNFTMCWVKENLVNLGIPSDARYIAWLDCDIEFRNRDWASETVHALQHYEIVQCWSEAIELGPQGQILALHRSFASLLHAGSPVLLCSPYKDTWRKDGGMLEYPHPGYAWAARRDALERLGGLFELGVSGSGDHHIALALIGKAERSMPSSVITACPALIKHLLAWQARALHHINQNIGYVANAIEHSFHGSSKNRRYWDRWSIFVEHAFDPDLDIKKNLFGVIELSGNKPGLRRDIDRYLRSRAEDQNTL